MMLLSHHTVPVRGAWQIQRAVLFALFLRELRARAGSRWIGLLWLLVEPLLHMSLLLAMFTYGNSAQIPAKRSSAHRMSLLES